MVRPLGATDDQIMAAARHVLSRQGYSGFSVSEVAKQVGLSRAAINLRFKGVAGLQRALLERMGDDYAAAMAACRAPPGAEGLLEIVELIGRMAGDRINFAENMTNFHASVIDADMAAFEQRRGEVLKRAIVRVMPQTSVPTPAAVAAFMAHIVGSLLAWQASATTDAASFLRQRTIDWLQLVGIAIPPAVSPTDAPGGRPDVADTGTGAGA